jgi:hypothetical protein
MVAMPLIRASGRIRPTSLSKKVLLGTISYIPPSRPPTRCLMPCLTGAFTHVKVSCMQHSHVHSVSMMPTNPPLRKHMVVVPSNTSAMSLALNMCSRALLLASSSVAEGVTVLLSCWAQLPVSSSRAQGETLLNTSRMD